MEHQQIYAVFENTPYYSSSKISKSCSKKPLAVRWMLISLWTFYLQQILWNTVRSNFSIKKTNIVAKSLGLKRVLISYILFRKNEVCPFLDCWLLKRVFNSFEFGRFRCWKVDTSFKYYLNSNSVVSQLVNESGFKYNPVKPQIIFMVSIS